MVPKLLQNNLQTILGYFSLKIYEIRIFDGLKGERDVLGWEMGIKITQHLFIQSPPTYSLWFNQISLLISLIANFYWLIDIVPTKTIVVVSHYHWL